MIKMTFVVWPMFVSSPSPSVWQRDANFSCWLWRLWTSLKKQLCLTVKLEAVFLLPTQSSGRSERAVWRNEDSVSPSNAAASGGNSSSGNNLHIQVEQISKSHLLTEEFAGLLGLWFQAHLAAAWSWWFYSQLVEKQGRLTWSRLPSTPSTASTDGETLHDPSLRDQKEPQPDPAIRSGLGPFGNIKAPWESAQGPRLRVSDPKTKRSNCRIVVRLNKNPSVRYNS